MYEEVLCELHFPSPAIGIIIPILQQYDKDLAAVKQNGLTLKYIKEQSQELCLAAVQQNG